MENTKIRQKNHTPSKEELKNEIITKMTELCLWKEELTEEIPTYWDVFNNFVIFNSKFLVDQIWSKGGTALWEHISKIFSGKSIGIQGKIQNNDFRSPNAKLLYGDSLWVEYLDNGINYTWNIEFTMFCTGNVSERHRIASLDCGDKVVVDMFAGIGYFTLPYLVHAQAKQVIACERNPVSVEALKANLAKNKVADRCVVLEGDVRLTCPRGVAEHVNMGLIPSCEQYWNTAAEILNPLGGTLHVHGNVTSKAKEKCKDQCIECLNLLETLSIDIKNPKMYLNDFKMSISHEGLAVIEELNSSDIKWKHIEWFMWSVHVSHSFCGYLFHITKTQWEVLPKSFHRVKAYAPHIDHLVLDIQCVNKTGDLQLSAN